MPSAEPPTTTTITPHTAAIATAARSATPTTPPSLVGLGATPLNLTSPNMAGSVGGPVSPVALSSSTPAALSTALHTRASGSVVSSWAMGAAAASASPHPAAALATAAAHAQPSTSPSKASAHTPTSAPPPVPLSSAALASAGRHPDSPHHHSHHSRHPHHTHHTHHAHHAAHFPAHAPFNALDAPPNWPPPANQRGSLSSPQLTFPPPHFGHGHPEAGHTPYYNPLPTHLEQDPAPAGSLGVGRRSTAGDDSLHPADAPAHQGGQVQLPEHPASSSPHAQPSGPTHFCYMPPHPREERPAPQPPSPTQYCPMPPHPREERPAPQPYATASLGTSPKGQASRPKGLSAGRPGQGGGLWRGRA